MKCSTCGDEDVSHFYPKNKTKCKKCQSLWVNQRYHNLPDDMKLQYKKRSGDWQDNNILLYRIRTAKSRALKSGIDFMIDYDLVSKLWEEQKGLCYYSNLPMKLQRDNNRFSVSLDRLDSTQGYVPGNVVLCCANINIMKNDLSLPEFKDLINVLFERTNYF